MNRVAEKVMGWELLKITPNKSRIYSDENGDWIRIGERGSCSAWQPSEDIAAAMQVVERMRELRFMLTLKNWSYYGELSYTAAFLKSGPRETSSEERAATAAEAIVKSALRALGEEV